MAPPKIFVSHSHKDDAFTERLVADLRQAGADAWMDKTDLGAGDFQDRISKALYDCEWFVLVLTKDALESNWVRQEVNVANILKQSEQIRDLIFIQAGPLEHREMPAFWRVFNIFDATTDYDSARDRTLKAVRLSPSIIPLPPIAPEHFPQQLASLGFVGKTVVVNGEPTEYIVPPLCDVAAGPFLMGYDERSITLGYDERSITLPAYQIARYPVTVAEYACFVRAGQPEPSEWQRQLPRLDNPVVSMSWYDAVAYAVWLSERTGQPWRLPTDEEWEKAARGPDGCVYPWGDIFDKFRCNTRESDIGGTTPIGTYPNGASSYGTQDQAGNVWEWIANRNDISSDVRVLRGGSWSSVAGDARAACRKLNRPMYVGVLGSIGFRLVVGAPAGSWPLLAELPRRLS